MAFVAIDGVKQRGVPVRITRYTAVFEIFVPNFVPKCSEVYGEFEITFHGKTLYSGLATVRNVIDAGMKTLCEVALDEASWIISDFRFEPQNHPVISQDFSGFMRDRQRFYQIVPEYKIIVADMQNLLSDLQRWLERLELSLNSPGATEYPAMDPDEFTEIARPILPCLDELFKKSEAIAKNIEKDRWPVHQNYMRRQLHPLVINVPFAHRSFQKPLGYAGDYEMMNMIHRNQPEGRSLYEKLVHFLLISQWPAISVRNRVTHLGKNIFHETARVARGGKVARILNIGCGPAWEAQVFLKESALSDHAKFTLIDFNQETLIHASQKLADAKRQFLRRTLIRTEQISVFELLRRTRGQNAWEEEFDLIYCAGLFDYLGPDTCRALTSLCYDLLAPGGLMLVANMTDTKPFRNFIESVMDWHLIYRDSREMMSLVPDRCLPTTRVIAEPTTVNLFLHTRKPE